LDHRWERSILGDDLYLQASPARSHKRRGTYAREEFAPQSILHVVFETVDESAHGAR
jgi:hypothetical protein